MYWQHKAKMGQLQEAGFQFNRRFPIIKGLSPEWCEIPIAGKVEDSYRENEVNENALESVKSFTDSATSCGIMGNFDQLLNFSSVTCKMEAITLRVMKIRNRAGTSLTHSLK